MNQRKNWGKYDPAISQAIIRELPKTWKELWNSPTLRDVVRSKLTLAEYLRHLRKTGAVRRIVDEETDKVLYTSKPGTLPKLHSSESATPLRNTFGDLEGQDARSRQALFPQSGPATWISLMRKRRRGFDVEDLYWGGQDLDAAGWWKQVGERSKSAQPIMKKAIELWFRDAYGQKFAGERVGTILNLMISQLVGAWIEVVRLYLGMVFAKSRLPSIVGIDANTRTRTIFNEPVQDGIRRIWMAYWFGGDPKSRIWEQARENVALLVLGVKAGYYSFEDLGTALVDAQVNLPHPRESKPTLDAIQDGEIAQLQADITSNDVTRRKRAEEILGLEPGLRETKVHS